MRILRWLASLAMLALLAPYAWTQLPASTVVTLTPQVLNANDTPDHVDLAIHRGAALSRAAVRVQLTDATTRKTIKAPYSASWQSSDPAVATITAGTITAKKAGSAQISVTVNGGSKGYLWVCVADTGAGVQPVARHPAPALSVDTLPRDVQWRADHPPPFLLYAAESTHFAATPAWPIACLHWSSIDSTRVRVVDRKLGIVANVSGDSLRPGKFLRVRVGPP